jgi:hypothetical protein
MYYEINVAKRKSEDGRYEHYFATAPRSIPYFEKALLMLKDFQVLFPSPEYDITIKKNSEQFTFYSSKEFVKEFEKKKLKKEDQAVGKK